jgi:hypothetical protein
MSPRFDCQSPDAKIKPRRNVNTAPPRSQSPRSAQLRLHCHFQKLRSMFMRICSCCLSCRTVILRRGVIDRDASPFVAEKWCSRSESARFHSPTQGKFAGGSTFLELQRRAFRRIEAGEPTFPGDWGESSGLVRLRSGNAGTGPCGGVYLRYRLVGRDMPRRTRMGIRPIVATEVNRDAQVRSFNRGWARMNADRRGF